MSLPSRSSLVRCEDVQADVSLLLGDDLPPARAAIVREHLAGCPACREELKEFRRVQSRLEELAPRDGESVPGGWRSLQQEILARVAADTGGEAAPSLRRRPKLGFLLRPAVAVVLFVGGVTLGRMDWYGVGVEESPATNSRGVSSGGWMQQGRTQPVSFFEPLPVEPAHRRSERLRLLLELGAPRLLGRRPAERD